MKSFKFLKKNWSIEDNPINSLINNIFLYGESDMNDIDRFDLEDQIFKTWNITNDLKELVDHFKSGDVIDIDSTMKMIDGIQKLYELRFEKLFLTLEKLIAENKLL